MNSGNPPFEVGLPANPLRDSLYNIRNDDFVFAPGELLVITTEAGDPITDELGNSLTTEG